MNTDTITNYLFAHVRLFFCVLALCWAFICNSRSKANNPYLMVLVAFLFPEIYLAQAFARRFVLNDYEC